jgi:hypothetical protein
MKQRSLRTLKVYLRELGVAGLPSLLLLGILGIQGCLLHQETGRVGAVRYVEIGTHVTPLTLYAQVGDEIRWQNLSPDPVRVGILDNQWRNHVACEKGFKGFGGMEDFVTIEPQEYVSLCFSRATTIRYNVWMDGHNLKGPMSPTAAIRID